MGKLEWALGEVLGNITGDNDPKRYDRLVDYIRITNRIKNNVEIAKHFNGVARELYTTIYIEGPCEYKNFCFDSNDGCTNLRKIRCEHSEGVF